MIVDEEVHLAHYGISRRSGRYPWGSGGTPAQRAKTFFDTIANLKEQGMSEVDIAKAFSTPEHPFTTKHLRQTKTIARNAKKAADIHQATTLKEKGLSNIEIGKKMGINESSVRSLLSASQKERNDILTTTSNMLRDQVDKHSYVEVGVGNEAYLGVSKEKLGSALALLKDEGYVIRQVQVEQAGVSNAAKKTTVTVLAKPGTTYPDIKNNMHLIQPLDQLGVKSTNGGRTFFGLVPPKALDSSRVAVRYAEEGGAKEDGVMYIRPGVKDLSLGGVRYAQVRVLVDGTHYMKGMAIYKDDLPQGVDVIYNSAKKRSDIGHDKSLAFKPAVTDADGKIDLDNPFGSAISHQIGDRDLNGNITNLTSTMNLVNREGDWDSWRKSLSSQVLSKQSPALARNQLNLAYQRDKDELDKILALTNPVIKKKLLDSYAKEADSAAVHLAAANMPRQRAQVILPLNSLKETEVYAPNFRNGERVALIRYPHGGTFEIPEVTVNNRHPDAISLLGQAKDAIAINAKVAERLSGADFDGDSVLVIPNETGALKSTPPIERLKSFDPRSEYPGYEGMQRMTPEGKAYHMGMVSNLITDMTIQGASRSELAQAVRHSMVVIDAEKHGLNYKLSYQQNGIPNLMKKYQPRDDGRGGGGAATLISRASGRKDVRDRRLRRAKEGGPIDPATGRLVYVDKDPTHVDPRTGRPVYKKIRSTKLAETHDARTLVSKEGGTPIEAVYADHSNRMKALANQARKEYIAIPNLVQSPSAKKVYAKEVESLTAKLRIAQRNSPLERQAQLITHSVVKAKQDANPGMDKDQVKKARLQALAQARSRTGAKKQLIQITDREWEAIQAGALPHTKLGDIIDNADLKVVRELATPRPKALMSGANLSRAKAMAAAGRTQAEIADALGVSLTTVKEGLG